MTPPSLPWRVATVAAMRAETPHVATLVLRVPDWPTHLAGQHVDLRLTAPDDYQAQRSYSIASAPGGDAIEITVERVAEGEVSPFLMDEVRIGDELELRGPIGGYFTWQPSDVGPLLLVAGGSGIAPLMAMLRQRARMGDGGTARLLYSSRDHDAIIYRDELEAMAASGDGFALTLTLTRAQPAGWTGERRRIDQAMLRAVGAGTDTHAFVCGPTPMVEQVAADLVALGCSEARIRTERFGPSGEAT